MEPLPRPCPGRHSCRGRGRRVGRDALAPFPGERAQQPALSAPLIRPCREAAVPGRGLGAHGAVPLPDRPPAALLLPAQLPARPARPLAPHERHRERASALHLPPARPLMPPPPPPGEAGGWGGGAQPPVALRSGAAGEPLCSFAGDGGAFLGAQVAGLRLMARLQLGGQRQEPALPRLRPPARCRRWSESAGSPALNPIRGIGFQGCGMGDLPARNALSSE